MSTKFQRSRPRVARQLRIALQDIETLIWRRVLEPDTIKLARLDRIVQAAMGWTNSHLHDWHIERQRYGIPDEEWAGSGDMRDERKFTIGAVLGEQINEFRYSYDFSDRWDHRITVEERPPIQEGRNDLADVPCRRERLTAGRCRWASGLYGVPAGHAGPTARATR